MGSRDAKPATDLRTRIITAMLSEDDVALMADAVIRVVSDEYVNSRGMFHEPDRCLGCEE